METYDLVNYSHCGSDIGVIYRFASSDDDERRVGAVNGAATAAIGCGYVLVQIFLLGIGIIILLFLFGVLF